MKVRKNLALIVLSLLVLMSLAPTKPPPGTGTPGYWKKHPDAWPVAEIGDGPVYSKADAIELMKMPVAGDKWLTLFKAFVAVWLNMKAGNDVSCEIPGSEYGIDDIIWHAQFWLAEHAGDRPVGGSDPAWQDGGEWKYKWLDKYNNGELCAPSRDALE